MKTLSNRQKFNQALELFKQVFEDWDDREIANYPDRLESFDELVSKLMGVEFWTPRFGELVQLRTNSRIARVGSVVGESVALEWLNDLGEKRQFEIANVVCSVDELLPYDNNCDEYACADCGAVFAGGEERDAHFMSYDCPKHHCTTI